MILNIVLLIIGFVILVKGADIFVDGASSVAGNFKVPKILIGLTIVAFGTSAPEFAVSIKSFVSNHYDIVLGNVIGSNILNILLIVGISSLVHPLVVNNETIKKELPITILFTILFAVLISDSLYDPNIKNAFTRSDGVVLCLFFLIFIYYLLSIMHHKTEDEKTEYLPLIKSIIFTVLGIALIVLGSNLVVNNAASIATVLGVSERLISLTIVALGTSLPELVTSVSATLKKEYEIAIGNVIGSNIFNIGIVLGLPVTIFGGIYKIGFSYIDLMVMILSAILLFCFALSKRNVNKREGIIFLIIFVIYYSYVIFV